MAQQPDPCMTVCRSGHTQIQSAGCPLRSLPRFPPFSPFLQEGRREEDLTRLIDPTTDSQRGASHRARDQVQAPEFQVTLADVPEGQCWPTLFRVNTSIPWEKKQKRC